MKRIITTILLALTIGSAVAQDKYLGAKIPCVENWGIAELKYEQLKDLERGIMYHYKGTDGKPYGVTGLIQIPRDEQNYAIVHFLQDFSVDYDIYDDGSLSLGYETFDREVLYVNEKLGYALYWYQSNSYRVYNVMETHIVLNE